MDVNALDERFAFATQLIAEAGALAHGYFMNRDIAGHPEQGPAGYGEPGRYGHRGADPRRPA